MTGYYPEMNEPRPADTQIEARLGHYGKHYFIRCCPELPRLAGRGIQFMGTETAESLVPGSKFVGWNRYEVTVNAFEKLDKAYRISSEFLL